MAKLTLKQLKEMIREAVRDAVQTQLQEQLSGGINVGQRQRRYVGGTQHSGGGMTVQKPKGVDLAGFNLEELVAMMQDNPNLDDNAKAKIKAEIMKKLKAAGW